jgi:hypothetical protein
MISRCPKAGKSYGNFGDERGYSWLNTTPPEKAGLGALSLAPGRSGVNDFTAEELGDASSGPAFTSTDAVTTRTGSRALQS